MRSTIVATFALGIGLAARGAAQEADAGVLRLHQAGMEVGREVFRETDRVLETTVTIPLLNAKIVSRIESRKPPD